jgi:hypothetical protein
MVVKGAKELRDPHSYVTFDDIFALALAKTKSIEFHAESSKWQEALNDICEKYKDRIVELKTMYFDKSRSDISPQSDEFYQLISILSASKLISLPNPTYERICMSDKQKERARELEEKLLAHYAEYIGEIADILQEKLGVET